MELDEADSGSSPPSSPTGRVPQWVLDEDARRALPPMTAPGRRAGRLRRAVGFLAAALVLVLAVGVLAGPHLVPWRTVAGPATRAPATGLPDASPSNPEPVKAPDHPSPGYEESRLPLGHPPPTPAGGGAHAFIDHQPDGVTPVAYDPCRPVHYVIHPDGEPAGGQEVIQAAVARVSEATGLRFVYDGGTDEASTVGRPIYQPARYGDRWAPVLFSWETEVANPHLAGEIVGEGGSTAVSLGDGPRVFVTGTVSLDAGQFPQILHRRKGKAIAQAIVLHELGHLVGLDHVDDAKQLMYPRSQGDVLDYGAGDLAGLAALGTGQCMPQV